LKKQILGLPINNCFIIDPRFKKQFFCKMSSFAVSTQLTSQSLKSHEEDVRVHLSEGQIIAKDRYKMCEQLLQLLDHVHDLKDLKFYWKLNRSSASYNRILKNCYDGFAIRIKIPEEIPVPVSEQIQKNSVIYTNDPEFLKPFLEGDDPEYMDISHMMCCPKPENIIKYPQFYELRKRMKHKIYDLIEASSELDPKEYVGAYFIVVKCKEPFREPDVDTSIPCDEKSIYSKYYNPDDYVYACYCNKCGKELCPWGCGRAVHENDNCHVTSELEEPMEPK
jgi:hypothetical protein